MCVDCIDDRPRLPFNAAEIQRAASERVDAGVAWLDDRSPGWANRIDLTRLDITSSTNCVVAQLFDGWHKRPRYLDETDGTGVSNDVLFGFAVSPFSDNTRVRFRDLDPFWRKVITERQQATGGYKPKKVGLLASLVGLFR